MEPRVRPWRFAFFAGLLSFLATVPSFGDTFTVTNTADSGAGSLRQAILDASVSFGNTITFSIGSGVKTIRPLSELPEAFVVTIDGTTQPGYAGTPLIEIDGSLLPALARCLRLVGGAVKALAINRCPYFGISASPATVTGCFLGTDVTGQTALGNGAGIQALDSGSVIGGTAASDRNVISGNGYGIYMSGSGTILGNFVGTNASGTAALPNLNDGIFVNSTSGVMIGGTASGARNLISGNGQYGVSIFYSTDVTIFGNWIGPSVSGGNLASSTQRAGVMVTSSSRNRVGGTRPGESNVIAFHTFTGIGVEPNSTRNTFSGNSLYANAFGVDLDFVLNNPGSRVTPNDPGDADTGPNLLQNFPVLEAVHSEGGATTVRGSINTTPKSPIHVELFSNASCNASGNGEGRTYFGSVDVVTNSSGNAIFEPSFSVTLLPEELVTATATDEFGDTSEFSPCQSMTGAPVGQQFFTLVACRVIDTRNADAPLSGPALEAVSTRTFALAGTCGVPASARSVSANLTVTQPAAPGHLIIHPADLGLPLASNVNFSPGQTRANSAILGLSNDGSGSITVENRSLGTVHFILDLNGYFQ
jgi:hypothetical protein